MRRKSVTGPLLLLLIGSLFLWRNLHPETPVFDLLAMYWPFLLILWGVMRLIEVVISPARRSPSFTGGEVVLVVLICVVGSGIWEGRQHGIRFNPGGLQVFGENYDYQVSAQGAAAGMKRVTFEVARGNIRITGGDGQDVVVTGRKSIRAWGRTDADKTNDNTPVEIVPQGDRLLIRSNHDRVPDNQRMSADLEVTIPKGMSVEARGRTGDFEVNDISGDVELVTDRSDVRIARIGGNARLEVGRSEVVRAIDVKGKVDLQGRGSDVELENISGQVTINGSYGGTLEFKNLAKPLQFEGTRNTELRAQAIPGRVSMDLTEITGSGLTGPVRLVTRSRDIKLEQFTQGLEIDTERGDVQLQPASPVSAIEARSGMGRIELVLPEKAAFDLHATAERGEVVNDYGAALQRETEGRTHTLKGKVGEGPSIRLTANHGSVSVRREGTMPSEIPPPPKPGRPPRAPRPPSSPEIKM
jgi:DUF4097 and DUF4098 domain-containing protein YvlB